MSVAEKMYKSHGAGWVIRITEEMIVAWKVEVRELRERIEVDTKKLRMIENKLEAARGLVEKGIDGVGKNVGRSAEEVESLGLSPAAYVRWMTRPAMGPMSVRELRARIEQSGYRITRYGGYWNYLYTILRRLQEGREIELVEGKIWPGTRGVNASRAVR